MLYDLAWFIATVFGERFAANLTPAQYDFAKTLAEDELANILCWCPKLYPQALSIKIALILESAGMGLAPPAPPVAGASAPTQEAYVIEDEVFDVRRKYKLVEAASQKVASSPASMLQTIIDRCKPPLRVGAFLAGGIRGMGLGNCCSSDPIGDKAEWNHGGQ